MNQLFAALKKDLEDLHKYRWALYGMVTSSLKTRYKRSYLGFFWSMLAPLMNYSVIGYVVLFVAKVNEPWYPTYMLLGSITFHFLSMCTSLGGASLLVNEAYIKKLYLPKIIFPISVICIELINYLLGFTTITLLLIALGKVQFSLALLTFPIGIFLSAIFAIGISNILSVVFIYFRDLQHIIPVLMQVIYYATPIVYPTSMSPPIVLWLNRVNPFYFLVEIIRRPLYLGEIAPTEMYVGATLYAFVFLTLGLLIIKKFDNKIIFRL